MYSSDAAKSADLKKLQFEMKKKEWDLNLVDFGEGEAEVCNCTS